MSIFWEIPLGPLEIAYKHSAIPLFYSFGEFAYKQNKSSFEDNVAIVKWVYSFYIRNTFLILIRTKPF